MSFTSSYTFLSQYDQLMLYVLFFSILSLKKSSSQFTAYVTLTFPQRAYSWAHYLGDAQRANIFLVLHQLLSVMANTVIVTASVQLHPVACNIRQYVVSFYGFLLYFIIRVCDIIPNKDRPRCQKGFYIYFDVLIIIGTASPLIMNHVLNTAHLIVLPL